MTLDHSLLGKTASPAAAYDPRLLFPVARAPQRAEIGITDPPPFHGVDIWNAYELSWLDARGKPCIALAEFRVPADSPNLIESKSLKLYLNSWMQERVPAADSLRARLAADLAVATGATVGVRLIEPDAFAVQRLVELDGVSIDALDATIDDYGPPNPSHLHAADGNAAVEETLVSHLLKSNCPVTAQPDWASVQIHYAGPRIDHAGLLRYLVSFRNHAGFHEHCVERIYVDLLRRCAPRRLRVSARYTRRGGIDINPWRSSAPADAPNPRGARQ
ncbi:MAG TPA: NADPH-dependent 7-cyano-7-deazaguanine reductase QueF [Rhodanobacteraceae bacterium]|nr:NADPH-dependent 7-cyano-7-deazaguanine reductase QueF [Rhodanobacteraceae bacterium]